MAAAFLLGSLLFDEHQELRHRPESAADGDDAKSMAPDVAQQIAATLDLDNELSDLAKRADGLSATEFAVEQLGDTAASATDSEWGSFPRSQFGIPRHLILLKKGPTDYYRHVRLNPSDLFIPKARREEFARLYASTSKLVADSRRLAMRVGSMELDGLIAAGRAQVADYNSSVAVLTGAARERHANLIEASIRNAQKLLATGKIDSDDPRLDSQRIHAYVPSDLFPHAIPAILRKEGSVIHAATANQLPMTAEVRTQEVAMLVGLASRIFNWFRSVGAIGSATESELMTEFVAAAASGYNNPK